MTNLNGLILTGGQSTRMGRDKSQLVYHGRPQREYLTDLLSPYCQEVVWSVNEAQAAELATKTQRYLIDAYAWPGPLNGILTAFKHKSDVAWLVVACDMPLLSKRSLDVLVQGRNLLKVATVFYDSDGKLPEPLLGIYEPAFELIGQQAVVQGHYSPRQLLQQNDIQLVAAPDIRELINVNDPTARAKLRL